MESLVVAVALTKKAQAIRHPAQLATIGLQFLCYKNPFPGFGTHAQN
jgi:hypothetical protein